MAPSHTTFFHTQKTKEGAEQDGELSYYVKSSFTGSSHLYTRKQGTPTPIVDFLVPLQKLKKPCSNPSLSQAARGEPRTANPKSNHSLYTLLPTHGSSYGAFVTLVTRLYFVVLTSAFWSPSAPFSKTVFILPGTEEWHLCK